MLSKDEVSTLLKLPDNQFVVTVALQIVESGLAENVMVILAQPNFEVLMRLGNELSNHHKNNDLPNDLDGTIQFIGDLIKNTTEEIGFRRLTWFLMAALVKRASQIAEHRTELHKSACLMWARLTEAGQHIHQIAPDIELWSDEEKEYFAEIGDAKGGIDYVYWALMPEWIRKTPEMQVLKTKAFISGA
jgi:uncharacterized protein (DUF1778 family)